MSETQTCSNGHPCDNEGLCRVDSCYYSRKQWLERSGG